MVSSSKDRIVCFNPDLSDVLKPIFKCNKTVFMHYLNLYFTYTLHYFILNNQCYDYLILRII